MKKSTRLLLALVVIEAILFGIAALLISGLTAGELTATGSPASAAQTMMTIFGGAMGALAAVVGLVVLLMRRKGL